MSLLKKREHDPYVLNFLNEQTEPVHKNIIHEGMKNILKPSEEDLSLVKESNGYSKFKDRVDWSLCYLKQAELIENVSRGIYQITDFGKKFLEENPDFNFKTMKDKTPYLQNRKSKKTDNEIEDTEISEETGSIKISTEEYYESIELEILNKLKSMGESSVDKGTKFEEICLELLKKMEYGDIERTGGAGDRGIDGILTMDKFGFDRIGVQCKCYSSGNIRDDEITKFAHGLRNVGGMNRGIFITTTDFTKQAKDVVSENKDVKIILIHGYKLAKLMREHQIGVEVMETNYIYNFLI